MQLAGKRARHAAYGVPLALALLIGYLYFRAQPHWLANPDAQDYAQLGRQLAQGRGPTTAFMPWNGLELLSERQADLTTWPNITRFPLTPVLMAASFALFGPGDESVHLPAMLGYVLAAAGAGVLGARAYGPWVGLVAGVSTASLPLHVNYTLTGLTEPLFGAFVVLTTACLVPRRTEPGPAVVSPGGPSARDGYASLRAPSGRLSGRDLAGPLLAGSLLGLAVLNRYDAAVLNLPLLALWLIRGRARVRRIALFLLPQALLVLPWSAFMFAQAGSPLFNLQSASIVARESGLTDGLGWYQPVYVTLADATAQDAGYAWDQGLEALGDVPDHLRKLLGWPLVLAGLVAGLLDLIPSIRRLSGGLGLFLLALVAVRILTLTGVGLSLSRYFIPVVPLLLVVIAGQADLVIRVGADVVSRSLGARRARSLAETKPRRPRQLGQSIAPVVFGRLLVAALLVVPSASVIGPFLIPPERPPGPPTRTGEVEARPENLARLAELVPPGAIVAANVPWSVAWHADRRSVPLPPTPGRTADLERRYRLALDAIYVAGQVSIADAPRSWRAWEELRRRGIPPPGYVLAESFPNGGRLYLRTP